jgi:TolA-binding protein
VASCYEQKGDFAGAAAAYEKAAATYPEHFQAPEYLLNAGRCYEVAGQVDNARRVYQKVVDDYPESNSIQQAKLTLAEI